MADQPLKLIEESETNLIHIAPTPSLVLIVGGSVLPHQVANNGAVSSAPL